MENLYTKEMLKAMYEYDVMYYGRERADKDWYKKHFKKVLKKGKIFYVFKKGLLI